MKPLLSLLSALLLMAFTAEQNDPRAKKILDELSAKTKTYTSIVADFTVTTENKKDKTSDTQKGKISIKGKKYKLEIADQVIISDNKTVWSVLAESKEIQVNDIGARSKEGAITPDNIFTIYETGFKNEFVKEEAQKSGAVYQYIKLFPIDTKKRNFHTALLTIDKKKKQIVSLKVMGKDGNDITYNIKSFQTNVNLDESLFSCDTKKYAGYEVIDLR
jgi:outer membrane lipoprotein carrier protein